MIDRVIFMEEKKDLLYCLKESFIKKNNITCIQPKKRMYSRKNNVHIIDICFKHKKAVSFMLKEYRGPDRQQRYDGEVFFYDTLKGLGLNMPRIFYKGKLFLILEYIAGQTLLHHINCNEEKNCCCGYGSQGSRELNISAFTEACFFINNFNKDLKKITGRSYVLNDMNLRNFLAQGNKTYRVDFEDCREGDIEEDFGKLIAFLLTYSPPYTPWKISISKQLKNFLKDYMGEDMSRIDFETEKELACMKKRRG